MFGWIRKLIPSSTLLRQRVQLLLDLVRRPSISNQEIENYHSGYRPPKEGDWTLIGNIEAEVLFGEQQELKTGTKHFSAGTKVYCLPPLWGDGYENIMVIGIARKPRRYISIVMPAKRIGNWRAGKLYKPAVLKRWQKVCNRRWRSREEVEGYAKLLPERNEEDGLKS